MTGRRQIERRSAELDRVIECAHGRCVLGGHERGGNALLGPGERPAAMEVPGDAGGKVGGEFAESGTGEERFGGPAVQADPPRRVQLRGDRLAGEGVDEAIRVGPIAGDQEIGVERPVESVEGIALVEAGDRGGSGERKVAVEHARRPQELLGRRRQAPQAVGDDVDDRARQRRRAA